MRRVFPLVVLLAAACSTPRTVPLAHAIDAGPGVQESAEPERDGGRTWLGAEVRGYPAGVMPTLYGETPVAERDVLTFSVGANVTDRRDWGEHDDEEGDGFGAGVGYRHYFGERYERWFLGGRVDVWSLSIDWDEDSGESGSSDVIVLQPTVECGYGFWLGEDWRCSVFAAAGAEINVDTDGEDVGEGGIGILGVSFVYGF